MLRARCLGRFAAALAGLLAALPAMSAEPVVSLVYPGREAGYALIRTPQLLVTRSGRMLAFAQGRSSPHDRSNNDIVVKRSEDGGESWSPLAVVADQGDDALNSICVVQLRATGRVLVVGCWLPDGYEFHESQYLSPALQAYQKQFGREGLPTLRTGYEGPGIARVYTLHSDDDGRTWSAPRDITRAAKRPGDILAIPGPGAALEMQGGPWAGRIVVPCFGRWLDRESTKPGYRSRPYVLWSDDGGATWQRGELAPAGPAAAEQSGDETQLVELPGGGLLLNTRAAGRNVARSADGGRTWTPLRVEPAIPTSPTAAGFLRYSGLGDGARSRLLFSNPAEPGRERGLVSLSYDDGQTWPVQRTIRPGRFKYSSLARLADGRIGCLFDGAIEPGEFGEQRGAAVLLARFSIEWLEADSPTPSD